MTDNNDATISIRQAISDAAIRYAEGDAESVELSDSFGSERALEDDQLAKDIASDMNARWDN